MSAQYVPIYNALDQCTGKRKYKRRRDAIKAKRQVQTAWAGVKLVPYPCPHCDWWHIGNNREVEQPKHGYMPRW